MLGISASPYVRHEKAVRFVGSTGLRLWIATGITVLLIAGVAALGIAHLERRANLASRFPEGPALNPGAAAALENEPNLRRLPIDESAVPTDTNLRGLGVRVGSNFHILTSRHLVHACPRLTVVDRDGLPHPAALVAEDGNNDMAVIRAGTLPPSAGITFRAFPPPAFNEQVSYIRPATFRRPHQKETTVGVARVADLARRSDSRLVTLVSDRRGNGPAFVGGDSGGPVVDTDGHLVGIIAGMLPKSRARQTEFVQSIGFMVNGGVIVLFLYANNVDYMIAHQHPEHPRHPPEETLENTVTVHCARQPRPVTVGSAPTTTSLLSAG